MVIPLISASVDELADALRYMKAAQERAIYRKRHARALETQRLGIALREQGELLYMEGTRKLVEADRIADKWTGTLLAHERLSGEGRLDMANSRTMRKEGVAMRVNASRLEREGNRIISAGRRELFLAEQVKPKKFKRE